MKWHLIVAALPLAGCAKLRKDPIYTACVERETERITRIDPRGAAEGEATPTQKIEIDTICVDEVHDAREAGTDEHPRTADAAEADEKPAPGSSPPPPPPPPPPPR